MHGRHEDNPLPDARGLDGFFHGLSDIHVFAAPCGRKGQVFGMEFHWFRAIQVSSEYWLRNCSSTAFGLLIGIIDADAKPIKRLPVFVHAPDECRKRQLLVFVGRGQGGGVVAVCAYLNDPTNLSLLRRFCRLDHRRFN